MTARTSRLVTALWCKLVSAIMLPPRACAEDKGLCADVLRSFPVLRSTSVLATWERETCSVPLAIVVGWTSILVVACRHVNGAGEWQLPHQTASHQPHDLSPVQVNSRCKQTARRGRPRGPRVAHLCPCHHGEAYLEPLRAENRWLSTTAR